MAAFLTIIVGAFVAWFAIVAILALPRAIGRGVTRTLTPAEKKSAAQRFMEEYRAAH